MNQLTEEIGYKYMVDVTTWELKPMNITFVSPKFHVIYVY